MILRIIYTFLIGIFLAVFVGVGISAFYKEPSYPQMPPVLKYCSPDMTGAQFADFQNKAAKYDQAENLYRQNLQIYNRNVSILAIIASIILVIASLTLLRTILLIADGILLGGVFSLIYSVIRGFGAQDTRFQFIVVSIGLFISLMLGYLKFIKNNQAAPKPSVSDR